MEENENKVVIDIKINQDEVAARLGEVNAEIMKLKASNNELKKSISEGNDEFGKNSRQLAENQAKLYSLNREQQSLTGRIEEATKETRTYGGSLKEQAGLLKEMKERYYALSKAERENSEIGGKLLTEIQALDKEIKEQDATIGNFQRNVGNYQSALQGFGDKARNASESFKAAGVSTESFENKLNVLNKNPFLLIVTAIVTILIKLRDRLKENATFTEGLGKSMKALQPILNIVNKAVDRLANLLVNALDWAIRGAINSIEWLGKVLNKVGGWFGKDWGGCLTEVAAQMNAARTATEETTEAVEELTESTSDMGKTFGKTAESVERVGNALANLVKTLPSYSEHLKKFSEEQVKRLSEAKKAFDEYKNEADKAAKVVVPALENVGKANDDNVPATSFFDKATAAFLNYAETISSVAGSLGTSFGSISSMYKQIADDESKTQQEREEAALTARRWAMLQVSANSAVSLATSIAKASENPWPANLAAIASSVATVLAFIAQAKQMLSSTEGFEHGGIIGGTSYSGDRVPVRGNSLEMVLTRGQQKTLFDIANGNVGGQNLTQSLVTALRSMPAPTLVYSEFSDFQGRVISLDNSQKIR